jgi:hypothetical protein
MNIFVLDRDPVKAAQFLKLGHLVKMPLESAQMLCTACHKLGLPAQYKSAYPNHPCTVWVQKSTKNLHWLVTHSLEICRMYTLFYGKRHKSQDVIEECANSVKLIEDDRLTPFAQAMPDEYRNTDSVSAYRRYYLIEKHNITPVGYARFVSFYNMVKEYELQNNI